MKTRSRLINIFATLFVALFVLACMAGFAACGGEEPGDTPVENPNVGTSSDGDGNKDVTDETIDKAASLSSISLDTSGAKTEYTIGDEFSSAGLVVTAKYDDNSTKTVIEYTVDSSSYNGEKAGAYGIIVSYTESEVTKNASYAVIVSEPPAAITLESISLNTSGAKTEYTTGESFTSEGLVVTASYSDNSSKTIAEYTVDSSQYKGDEAGAYTIIVSYTEDGVTVSTSYSVTVSEPEPTYQLIYALSLDRESYEVLGIDGEYDAVTIPAEYEGLPVTAISARAFYNCISLTEITIPDTLTSIGAYAFYNCRLLMDINIPDSLTSLGEYAFFDCYNLRRAVIVDGVERIADYTFYGCSSLAKVTVGKSVGTIGSYAFYGCTSLSEIDLESSQKLTTIGEQAFCNCSSLAQIAIPDSVTTMGGACFSGCSKLESITLSFVGAEKNASNASASSLFGYIFGTSSYTGSVEINQYYDSSNSATYYIPNTLECVTVSGGKIMYGAFYGCTSLTRVTIGENVEDIEDVAFYNCSSLTEIYYNALNVSDATSSSSTFGYIGASNETLTLTIGAKVGRIPSFLFQQSAVTDLVFEEGSQCTAIGERAFSTCESLTTLTIPDNVTTLETGAFRDCTALSVIYYNAINADNLSSNNYVFRNAGRDGDGVTVMIGASVTKIPAYIFYPSGAPKITDVVFEEGSVCESIGARAFYACDSLASINVPDGVTSIGNYAFYGCTSLTSIIIPDSVTSVGEYAFSGCTALQTAVIGGGVSVIRGRTFYNCTSLENVTIGSSVESIENYAFYNCTSLKEINYNAANLSDLSVDNYVFYNAGAESESLAVTIGKDVVALPDYLFYPYSGSLSCSPSIVSVVFEDVSQCESIGDYTFYSCGLLTSIVIPDSVTIIGNYTFYDCSSLESVILSDGLTSVGQYAFYGCTSIDALVIPDEVTFIGDYAFYDCSSLISLAIGESVTTIGVCAFYGCVSLEKMEYNAISVDDLKYNSDVFYRAGIDGDGVDVIIGANVKTIPEYLFHPSSSTPRITSIVFEENSQCVSIGERAFQGCTYLTDLIIPDSVVDIGYMMCYGCTSLETLVIGLGVENLGDGAFGGCSSLVDIVYNARNIAEASSYNYVFQYAGTGVDTTVTIGANVECVPSNLFAHSYITNVVFEDGSRCVSIGDAVFYGCTYLTDIVISDSVTSIGGSAFYNCTSLTSAVISSNLMCIQFNTFYGCSSLESVTLGSCLEYISQNAFYNCTSLANINIPDSVTSIGSYAFYNCASLTTITIPDGVTEIPYYTFAGCISLESLTIGDGVTSIGDYAFYNCTSLTEINFNAMSMENLSSNNCVFYKAGQSGSGIAVTIGSDVEKIPAYLFCPYLDSSSYAPKITVVIFEEGSQCASIGTYAFYNCTSLTGVYISSVVEWLKIDFDDERANPLFYAGNLYLNDNLVTAIDLSDSVTTIGAYAFLRCSSLTSVTIGKGVETIDHSAFSSCTSLTSVMISDSVTSIGNYAFRGCTSLMSVTIGEKVETIGDYAFYNCTSLTEINFNATSMENLSSNNYVFYKAGQSGSGIAVTIGSDVEKIPAYLFCPYLDSSSYAPKITVVIFEEGSQCASIGTYAFYGCTSLTSITIPDGLTTIRSHAFSSCTSLMSVTIGEKVETIGNYAFYNCTSLTEINFNATSMEDLSSNNRVFQNAGTGGDGITVMIGANVTKIPAYLFYPYDNSTYITTVVFEENSQCTSIGNRAFCNCASLTDVTLPESVTSIESHAFFGCSSLTAVVIPSGVTTIGEYAFDGCTSLTSIIIPENVTIIGNYAFYNCTSLTEINFNATNMEDLSSSNHVFHNAGTSRGGITVTIGANVTKIPAYLFYPYVFYLPYITALVFEENSQCTSIGNYAFSFCSSLTYITLPDSVESIGSHAFYDCSSLTAVYYTGTSEQWSAITVGDNNDPLSAATIYYYSDEEPDYTDGNSYWHYVEGEIVVWTKQS